MRVATAWRLFTIGKSAVSMRAAKTPVSTGKAALRFFSEILVADPEEWGRAEFRRRPAGSVQGRALIVLVDLREALAAALSARVRVIPLTQVLDLMCSIHVLAGCYL